MRNKRDYESEYQYSINKPASPLFGFEHVRVARPDGKTDRKLYGKESRFLSNMANQLAVFSPAKSADPETRKTLFKQMVEGFRADAKEYPPAVQAEAERLIAPYLEYLK